MSKGVVEEVIPIVREAHLLLQKAGLYERFLQFLQRKNAYPIVVFGASGTGKTAVIRSLAGLSPHVRREDRTDAVKAAKNKLAESFIEMIDTPGEAEHEAKRIELIRTIQKRSSVGIINVVSHGYHEGKALKAAALEGTKASPSFLERRRELELAQVGEWAGPLCGPGGSVSWILTVVSKADLWWQSGIDQDVLESYRQAPYSKALSVSDGTPHSVKPYSSLNQLFYEEMPMSGYYPDTRRKEDHVALIAHILEKVSEHG